MELNIKDCQNDKQCLRRGFREDLLKNCIVQAKEEQSVVIIGIHPCNTVFTAVGPNGELIEVDIKIPNYNTKYYTIFEEGYSSSEEGYSSSEEESLSL